MSRPESPHDPSSRPVSRRGLLARTAVAGGLTLGTAAFGPVGPAIHPAFADSATADEGDVVDLDRQYPFYGEREQAGISTPPQRYSVFMTFDLTS
ncbi:MAG: deferrochelatase/peroxidase EfeB, partial [Thermomicrobiales bacterium]